MITESVPVLHILYEGKREHFVWKACLFVCLSVTKSQQLSHFSGSYEIWCTSFFSEKLSIMHEFHENRFIDSLTSFKSFM